MDYKQHKGNLRGQIKDKTERKLYNKRIRVADKDVDILPDFELNFCPKCIQMTNHLDGICQKCKVDYTFLANAT